MNDKEKQNIENSSILEITHELLKDPKILAGLVGLGMCVPFVLPSVTTIIPIAATLITKCGYATIGGITTYVSMDLIKDIIKK